MAITRRQKQVYDFISEFVGRNGYSPSFEEIGGGLGLSSLATVHKHISNLEKKGLLRRDYNRSRSIDVIAPKGASDAVEDEDEDDTSCCRRGAEDDAVTDCPFHSSSSLPCMAMAVLRAS
jgi:SOS-response transcriptional repressor LexA